MPLESGIVEEALARTADLALAGSTAKQFHRRNVSSAAPDTTLVPSGDMAICSTRSV